MLEDWNQRWIGDTPTPEAVAGLLLSLVQTLLKIEAQSASHFLALWDGAIQRMLADHPYLTLDDAQGIQDMYTEVRKRIQAEP